MPKKKASPQGISTPEAAPKRKGRPAKAAAPAKSEVIVPLTIDYPLEGEIVTSAAYTMRLTAAEPSSVEVSFNGKTWAPCRESVGNWWFDWSGYQAGAYSLVARMTDKSGKSVKTKARSFTVLI